MLRRTPGAADAEATAAASTAGAAAAAGAGPSQREEHTSLGLSLGRGAGGTWSQVLWAQMLRDHEEAEGYEEDEYEYEDEGDEEEGFESEEDVDAVMGSDDEMETEEEEGALGLAGWGEAGAGLPQQLPRAGACRAPRRRSFAAMPGCTSRRLPARIPTAAAAAVGCVAGDEDEEWVPGGASAEHPASMPAHAVHAGVAPAMATGLASSGHALGEIMARLQDVAGEQGAAAAAAGQGQEQEWVAEGQYEWWYPEVGGEAPGARGYHSAAASEDGRQVGLGRGRLFGAAGLLPRRPGPPCAVAGWGAHHDQAGWHKTPAPCCAALRCVASSAPAALRASHPPPPHTSTPRR